MSDEPIADELRKFLEEHEALQEDAGAVQEEPKPNRLSRLFRRKRLDK